MRYEFENDYITFTRSNKKLQETDNIRWFIFSLPAEITCPFSTCACRASCYAKKAERIYPTVRASRANNFELLKRDSTKFFYMVENAIMREYKLARLAGKRLIVRWHESGDFFSYGYMSKWLKSMRYLTFVLPEISITAYTKSVYYLEGMDYDRYIDRNINIIFSQWNDTPSRQSKIAKTLGLTVYTAETSDVYNNLDSTIKCPCNNCATCLKCYDDLPEKLVVKIH